MREISETTEHRSRKACFRTYHARIDGRVAIFFWLVTMYTRQGLGVLPIDGCRKSRLK